MNRFIIAIGLIVGLVFVCWCIGFKTITVGIKKIYDKFTLSFQQKIRSFRAWLNKKVGRDELTLTARVFKKDSFYSTYMSALECNYRTKDVLNIAIIGEKGVGKTSFVKTYEASHTLPFCKYLYVSVGDCFATKNAEESESVEAHLVKQIFSRAHRGDIPETVFKLIPEKRKRPTLLIVVVVLLLGLWGLLLTFDQWGSILLSEQESSVKAVLYIVAVLASVVAVLLVALKVWNRFEMSSVKIGVKGVETQFDKHEKVSIDRYSDEIIYALKAMRWRIGHTVVIEDMDLLDKEECLKVFSKLKLLNKNLNSNLLTLRFFNITGIARPIRFLYVFGMNTYAEIDGSKFFQADIQIENRVVGHSIAEYVNDTLKKEAKKRNYPMDMIENIHIDAEFLYHLSAYLSEWRVINSIIKAFYSSWEIFLHQRRNGDLFVDDPKKLFSFTIYSRLFPSDKAKFGSGKCFADNNNNDRTELDACEMYDESQKDLLWYMIRLCPEPYRINYLCKRYGNINYTRDEQYFEEMKKSIAQHNYEWALECIELALCCEPNKSDYYRWRREIFKLLQKKGDEAFDISQEKRWSE